MGKGLKISILFFLSFSISNVQSQVTKVVNENIWITYAGVHPISKKLSIQAELSWRRNQFFQNPQQLLIRTGLNANLGKGFSIGGGYCFAETYPYGGMPSKATFPENRLWEQLQMRKSWKQIELVSRLRLEQRFVYQPTLSGAAYVPGPAVYSTRIRLMQRVSIPLNAQSIKENTVYATALDELFYGFGKTIGSYHFDQNRFFVGIGYVMQGFGRVEAGYLHQQIIRGAGTKIENNRTIQINFLPNLSLFNNQ